MEDHEKTKINTEDLNAMKDTTISGADLIKEAAENKIKLNEITDDLNHTVLEYKNKYLRLLADVENSRKRMIKEKNEMTQFAIENVLCEILIPIDILENALKLKSQMSEETYKWATGFQMILDQFNDILGNYNIKSFKSIGEKFNPMIHEAVEMEETDSEKDGIILEEFVKGYKSKDRTIRPARVKVAKQVPSSQKINDINNKKQQIQEDKNV